MGVVTTGLVAAGCFQARPAPAVPAVPPLLPAGGRPTVAVAQAASYDRALVRRQVQALLEGLGGIEDVVRPGARVALKVNLTGGVGVQPLAGVAPVESYVTHPEVVRALCELLVDAGAAALSIVEAVYQWNSYTDWGYEDIARPLNARLIDLNAPGPYPDFGMLPVGPNWMAYEEFVGNRILAEADVFVSVAKMKCHSTAGVTHAMKNLVGLVPAKSYAVHPADIARSAFHVQESGSRALLPRVIVDLNRARPIHLALVDGIKTMDGAEGPWIKGCGAIAPGLLVAGKQALATDAVATALQGFDPTSDYPQVPFRRGANHLNLARAAGLGTNRLDEIDVAGPVIADLRYPFRHVG